MSLGRAATWMLCAAALTAAAACGSPGPPPRTTPGTSVSPRTSPAAPKPKGFFTLSIQDSVRGSASVTCPAGTPAAAQCYVLVESGDSPQLGAVTVAPVLDVEFPTQPPCGTAHSFTEKLTFASGSLVVKITGPYLCLGAIGATERRFVVKSGTGRFASDTGSGTIEFDSLTSGAAESWTGILSPR